MTDPLIALLCTFILAAMLAWVGLEIAKALTLIAAAILECQNRTVKHILAEDAVEDDGEEPEPGEEWKGGLN